MGQLALPSTDALGRLLDGSGDRPMSTTMAFVRWLTQLVRDKGIGARVVPIVPDEARTFGMEGLFRTLKIYSAVGQRYDPVDSAQLLAYREARDGQILEEGITEAGAMASWIAAATAYANHGETMLPFYIYYSMFGFQRVGDLAWAAADMQARGFLLGGTAGRTTLAGEGLQHQDGHSHVLASVIPSCRAYDPCFAYELSVILDEGMRRMFVEHERAFYYVTLGNESYPHPSLPSRDGVREGIVRGLYRLREASPEARDRVQLLGSGPILREVLAAADLLDHDWGIGTDVWSVTSFGELRRDGLAVERWNLLHPQEDQRVPYVARCLSGHPGPVIAASDYLKLHADQIRAFLPDRRYLALGTDGFGRSDDRQNLRRFFEVDACFIAFAALAMLAREGLIPPSQVTSAARKYGIDCDRANPVLA
jgi:pyruvate dehydrogenase E1 component